MKRDKDLFSEVIVGIFMTAVIALLAYFTIVISGVDLMLGRAKVHATIQFTDVGGLKERDNVIYRGMKVGVVEKISLAPSNIAVIVAVDSDVVLRETCRIGVAPLSLLGGNCLQLEEGAGTIQPLTTTIFKGEPPTDWMRDLGEIARKLNDITEGKTLKNIVTNLEEAAGNLNRIVARVERGEGTIGKLLSADNTLFNDVRDTVHSAKIVAGRLERGEGTIGKLLSTEDTIYVDLKTTLARAAEISNRLASGQGTLGGLLATNDTLYADLKASVENIRSVTARLDDGQGLLGRLTTENQLATDAEELVANLKRVSARLEKGEGTLGKLTTDSALYDDVNGLVKDLRQIIDNYRDTTPITTFGSLALGAL